MSSTGITTSRSSSLRWPASTSVISRPVPATKRPISASGRCVAESPIRWNGRSTSCSSRSSESARCAPRFVPATACTSSRISVSTLRSISRPCEVRSRNSDSGVVMRTSGGVRSIRCRSRCGVSPVRTPTVSCEPSPASGPAEVPLDVVVERLQRRDVEQPEALARRLVQPVDALEERGERLPGAGRRLDEDVRAGRDRRPGELLRGRRAGERALEPGSRRRGQRCERDPRLEGSPRARLRPTASRTAVDRSLAWSHDVLDRRVGSRGQRARRRGAVARVQHRRRMRVGAARGRRRRDAVVHRARLRPARARVDAERRASARSARRAAGGGRAARRAAGRIRRPQGTDGRAHRRELHPPLRRPPGCRVQRPGQHAPLGRGVAGDGRGVHRDAGARSRSASSPRSTRRRRPAATSAAGRRRGSSS